jgi:hypothetical protein
MTTTAVISIRSRCLEEPEVRLNRIGKALQFPFGFCSLQNTNPILWKNGPERQLLEEFGIEVAVDGEKSKHPPIQTPDACVIQ